MNNTLTNGFKLLELLAASKSDSSVTELAEQMGRPASHVCRLLKTLVRTGYVEQNENTRKYRVSLRLLNLSHVRLSRLDFRKIGHAYAVRLAHKQKAPVYLSQPMKGQSIIVDVAHPAGSTQDLGIVVGQIHSAQLHACGKLCAAFASAEEQAQLGQLLMEQDQSFDLQSWLTDLSAIKSEGLAIRQAKGLLAMAAPVFMAEGNFCGAMGICFSKNPRSPEVAREALIQAAGGLSFALGFPVSN